MGKSIASITVEIVIAFLTPGIPMHYDPLHSFDPPLHIAFHSTFTHSPQHRRLS